MFSLPTVSTALFWVSALFSQSIPADNNPTRVHLRIEGADKTIFEGPIVTMGHTVTTASGGTHHCDGTNNKAHEFPVPTCTSALDNASKENGFQWDGTWNIKLDDYIITSIGDSTQTATQFWGILLNFRFTQVGGCQQEVKPVDHILFAFDAFNAQHFLQLVGPTTAAEGVPAKFTVTDGRTGEPVEGASVDGKTSDADGVVFVTFAKKGPHGVKATMDGSIRSNQVDVKVV